MAKRITLWEAGDGSHHASKAEADAHDARPERIELLREFLFLGPFESLALPSGRLEEVASELYENRTELLALLKSFN